MIRYSLRCADEHRFDSWFQSVEAYASLAEAGHVMCPVCGSVEIEKDLMAPSVRPARDKAAPPPTAKPEKERKSGKERNPEKGKGKDPKESGKGALVAPASQSEAALVELRRKVEENSEYVGQEFASEARKMHDGEIPHRSIYGEAGSEDARKLLEDGVPVAPLPFIPTRKSN